MKNIINASKQNPCPHCGKPDWCYSVGDLSVCNRDCPPADGWVETKAVDKNGKKFYALEATQIKASSKPEVIKTTYYDYPDRQGNKLARSVRLDLSNGDKQIWGESWTGRGWTKTTKHIDRASIPIYRYQEVRAAIAKGESIFWVEGEKCVEALEKLGLIATTNFGGSARLVDSDLSDLDGANLIICPDRDQPGVKLADKVAQKFPAAKWLYAFPDSPLWNSPPPSKGADVADWIRDLNLSANQILEKVEEKRSIDGEQQKLTMLGFTDSDKQKLESIREAIDGLIADKKSESEKLAFLTQLASVIRWDDSKLKAYYHLRLKELDEEETKADTQSEIDQILDSLNDDITFEELVNQSLIPDLEKLAEQLKYKRSSLYTTLLTAVSVLHKVGTKISLADNFDISPNIYSLEVSPSGQGKTPKINTLVTKPFSMIEADFLREWESNCDNYAQQMAEYNLMSKDEQKEFLATHGVPKKPPSFPKILYATDLNTIAVAKQFRQYPEQGFLGNYDEARKLFNFKGGGRNDDESNLCSLYDGSGIKELRAAEDRAAVLATNFGICGNIQPRILLDLMGDADDSQGQWARFIYTFQGKQQKIYDLKYGDSKKMDLPTKLANFYRLILQLPAKTYRLTPEGQQTLSFYLTNCTETQRMKENDSVMETFLGKAGSRIAKLIVNIHLLKWNEASKTELIEDATIYSAIALDEYYTNQLRILYSKSRAVKGELAPKLVEILRIWGSALCPVSARDVARASWIFKKDKDSSDQIRGYFRRLESMGYGVCQGSGSKMTFRGF